MRRRQFVLGVAAASLGGCSAREGNRTDTTGPTRTLTPASDGGSGTPTGTPASTARADAEPTETEPTATPTPSADVASAREHLAVAFDELREMRPVGSETIRFSEKRFIASDHEVVRERVDAAEAALDRAPAANGDGSESVSALRTMVELARAGVDLYDAVRRGIRAEWRFEGYCFGAEWATARDSARSAGGAVAAWETHGRAVAEAATSVRDADPFPIPGLSLRAWYRDGAVLRGVAGPWGDVLGGFGSFSEAVRLDEVGRVAMDDGEFRRAGERFAGAADSVGEAHVRLARAKADDAQAFQTYALPIRRRCGPFRKAYITQFEAAGAAASGETDRAETFESKAMDRIVETERKHPLPRPEGG